MSLLPYDNVPLYLASKNTEGEYVFAERASLNLNQDVALLRQMDDNIIQICSYNQGSELIYEPHTFTANQDIDVTLGPIGGPPRPLATSIHSIPEDSKITFRNGKHLYFRDKIQPNGNNYIVTLYSKSGNWSLSEEEAQHGHFEPDYVYAPRSPIAGSLEVDFYLNTGNMPSFFNITGIDDPTKFPPVSNDVITGFLGDFSFQNAYLSSFSFTVSANALSQASASFLLYGSIVKDTSLSANYYSSDLYQQQSLPHGDRSKVLGIEAVGMEHVISFSYSASINREPKYDPPMYDEIPEFGIAPYRVSKKDTVVTISLVGTNIDPSIIQKAINRETVELSCELYDLSYDAYENNSAGFMQKFNCNGFVTSESVSVNSLGFLEGGLTITKTIQ